MNKTLITILIVLLLASNAKLLLIGFYKLVFFACLNLHIIGACYLGMGLAGPG